MCELVGLKVVGLKRIRIGEGDAGQPARRPVALYLGPHERFEIFAAALLGRCRVTGGRC